MLKFLLVYDPLLYSNIYSQTKKEGVLPLLIGKKFSFKRQKILFFSEGRSDLTKSAKIAYQIGLF
ncbi:MAG: hypothetical protein A3H01_02415 [Candidatus Wildermuthbacteria bacterium RIFCSPLOWO2_12_FULL_40_9]|uniref:Uncharacterized protein n=2 Tax=Candidatus Wildermuthiibacteriota TaxID=1817923 RepID=A0A1G2RB29_9BACT|nr:MAG: hypothetical protein A3F15_00795 [Candidatus Wildermuthbacteria bacterium RIFCSPHIGHO2_12_FULL_40_12]OHA76947.1 MAG: hypothetical protein A3H01_02415 [Candidatus Wildermuthbacteria bacterium RIFCSPLOWO2_12_FULL_40_9]